MQEVHAGPIVLAEIGNLVQILHILKIDSIVYVQNCFVLFHVHVSFVFLLLLLPPSYVTIVANPQRISITCMLCYHSSLGSASAGIKMLSNQRRHLVETLHLQLELMTPMHLSNEDLPLMKDALLMISKVIMMMLALPFLNGRSIDGETQAGWSCRSLG